MNAYIFCKGHSIDHAFPHREDKEKEDILSLLKRDGLEIVMLPEIISQEELNKKNASDIIMWSTIGECDTIGDGNECPEVVGNMAVEDMNDGLVIINCSQQMSVIVSDCINANGGKSRCFEMNEGWDKNMECTFDHWWDTEGFELCYKRKEVGLFQKEKMARACKKFGSNLKFVEALKKFAP